MRIKFGLYFILVSLIKSQIIPLEFKDIDGKPHIEILKWKDIISCQISTIVGKNYMTEDLNEKSKTKRKQDDSSMGFFDRINTFNTQIKIYEDLFSVNKNQFVLKYYLDPNMKTALFL